jgi:hypothetical protein
MEGAPLDLLGGGPDQAFAAPDHLLGGPTGEGEQEDAPRRNAAADEGGDPVDERPGLPRAGTGHDEERGVPMGGGVGLGGVERRPGGAGRRGRDDPSGGKGHVDPGRLGHGRESSSRAGLVTLSGVVRLGRWDPGSVTTPGENGLQGVDNSRRAGHFDRIVTIGTKSRGGRLLDRTGMRPYVSA